VSLLKSVNVLGCEQEQSLAMLRAISLASPPEIDPTEKRYVNK
jgi:hypothetical protein